MNLLQPSVQFQLIEPALLTLQKKDRINAITRGWNSANKTIEPNPDPTPNPTPAPLPTPSPTNVPANDASWIAITIQSDKDEQVMLSDDGKNYQAAVIKKDQSFVFLFEIYKYGWLKLPYYNGYRVYKLLHGKDYSILWNRRTKNWTVVEVPD